MLIIECEREICLVDLPISLSNHDNVNVNVNVKMKMRGEMQIAISKGIT